jgi:isoamylase
MIDVSATDETDARGRPIEGDTLLLAMNGGATARNFRLPQTDAAGRWSEIVRTASGERRALRGEALHLAAHSLVLLRFGRARRARPQPARGSVRR